MSQLSTFGYIIQEQREKIIKKVKFINKKLTEKIYQKNINSMDRFRESRKQSLHKKEPKQNPTPFTSYSPEKIRQQVHREDMGESRFGTNRFTQTGLLKQQTIIRKYEQTQSKLREKQIAYRHQTDMLDKVIKQKQGIEASLSHQIEMYKELIKQIEFKAEERLKQVQKAFKQQMQRKLEQKEQEARIMQAQKQQLQHFVDQLEKIGDELETKLNYTEADLKNTQQNLKKTDDERKVLMQKLDAAQQHSKAQAQRFQEAIDGLKQKVVSTQRQWRDKLDEAGKQREKALKDLQKQWKQQINKLNEKHESEKNDRKEEIKNIMDGFQAQKNRLNQLIASKERAIQQHHRQSKDASQKLNSQIRGYELEIQSLAGQKARLFEEVDNLNSQNTHLNVLIKDLQINGASQKKNLQAYVLKLKDDINYSQSNFLRERDRNVVHYQDSSKQIISLKKQLAILQAQNEHLKHDGADSNILANEVRKLRDMLLQSSYQMQKCKAEFIKISKERDMLAMKLNQSIYEVGTLRRIKNENQEQARGWRDSYYLNRSRSIRR